MRALQTIGVNVSKVMGKRPMADTIIARKWQANLRSGKPLEWRFRIGRAFVRYKWYPHQADYNGARTIRRQMFNFTSYVLVIHWLWWYLDLSDTRLARWVRHG